MNNESNGSTLDVYKLFEAIKRIYAARGIDIEYTIKRKDEM